MWQIGRGCKVLNCISALLCTRHLVVVRTRKRQRYVPFEATYPTSEQ